MRLKLYHYWRSSSSWRVRWAFALKGVTCEYVAVNLMNGESESDEHLRRNPLGYVPVLELDSQGSGMPPRYIAESMAILEWSEEVFPAVPILPDNALDRAHVRQLAEIINADTQPLQNLNPQYLHSDDPEKRKAWAQHWIRNGLEAYEKVVAQTAGQFSFEDRITTADLCLIPQCYNAQRFDVSLDAYPTIQRIYQNAQLTSGYLESCPERYQPAQMG